MKRTGKLLLTLVLVGLFVVSVFILAGQDDCGDVLLSYEMTSAGDAVEIRLEEGDDYDTLHFVELAPVWDGCPFKKVISEHTYRLKKIGVERYSLKERDAGGITSGYISQQLDETIEAPALGDGLHILYGFMPATPQYAPHQRERGYLYAGVTTDPELMIDARTVQMVRLDDSFYVYFWVDYSYAD